MSRPNHYVMLSELNLNIFLDGLMDIADIIQNAFIQVLRTVGNNDLTAQGLALMDISLIELIDIIAQMKYPYLHPNDSY